MSGALPHFWHTPFRYLRWAAREQPAYFYSCVIAGLGPVFLTVVPPVRKYFGDVNPAPIPVTYPSTSSYFAYFVKLGRKGDKQTEDRWRNTNEGGGQLLM